MSTHPSDALSPPVTPCYLPLGVSKSGEAETALRRHTDVEEPTEQRLLVISPVRNEAAHIERVASALASQTRPPDRWVVVDDQSTDATPQILDELASRLDFMSVIHSSSLADEPAAKDRLARAAPPRSFNRGLNSVEWRSFTHISKLDGDIELPPDYFERLLEEFTHDSELGLAGGVLREREGDGWRREQAASAYHVRGGLKCYSRDCLEAIGGIQERLAWDAIDQVYARMRGFQTRGMPQLVALHHRPTGSADGVLRGRARHGRVAYIIHFTPLWVTLRAFKVAKERPRGLSGLAFLFGYFRSAVLRVPRVDDPEFREFVHAELRDRARGELAHRFGRRRTLVSVSVHER
jgi:poly-beta-1,6-N-acetyl-D-glucosamine synthase